MYSLIRATPAAQRAFFVWVLVLAGTAFTGRTQANTPPESPVPPFGTELVTDEIIWEDAFRLWFEILRQVSELSLPAPTLSTSGLMRGTLDVYNGGGGPRFPSGGVPEDYRNAAQALLELTQNAPSYVDSDTRAAFKQLMQQEAGRH